MRDHGRVVVGALGDQRGTAGPSRSLEAGGQLGQLGQEGRGRGVDDRVDRVEAQRVDVEVDEPLRDALEEIGADVVRPRPVEVEGRSPGRLVALGEVRAEGAEDVADRPEVVVDHVEDHREAALVAGVDEALQPGRPPVGVLHREGEDPVVAPVARAGELGHRHDLDGRDPDLDEVVEHPGRGRRRCRFR